LFNDFIVFLVEFKGTKIKAFFTLSSLNNKQFLADVDNKCFTTKLGQVDKNVIITTLNDQATYHAITKHNIFTKGQQSQDQSSTKVFLLDKYSLNEFYGIMPDTGALGISLAGEQQYITLRRDYLDL
jgi:hypothetical protein